MRPSNRRSRTSARRRTYAVGAGLACVLGLAACSGGDDGPPELTWYINPDTGGQDAVAAACSTDDYTITTQVLPADANQQRIQLARRLAAGDTEIDIMSIDPPFTAEFADAGYLAEIPQDMQDAFREQAFESAATAATWNDQLVVAPFWSNTQVLWYRKSFVEEAGLDMSQPVTWDQIIQAASDGGGSVAVQANKYEGYAVWINSLIAGAGGGIASETEKGIDAQIDIGSQAGRDAAAVVSGLSGSEAAPADLSIAQEGQAAATFATDEGAFMVNWTFIYAGAGYPEEIVKDLGWARYPQTVEGEESRPPYGGIGIGVSAFSEHQEQSVAALECLTSPENQAINAELTGNMPSSAAGYDEPKVKELFPADLITLFQQSLETAAPRTLTPYWSDISGSIQSIWHPPSGVTEQTPEESAQFIEDVLQGRSLL